MNRDKIKSLRFIIIALKIEIEQLNEDIKRYEEMIAELEGENDGNEMQSES